MSDLLIDTTIIIDALKEHAGAVEYLDHLLRNGPALTHGMVAGEVIEGTRDAKDLIRSRRFLRAFNVIHASEADSAAAIESLSRVHLSHGVGLPDCLIAATAIRLGLGVVTINDRDFRLFKGLVVIRPY